MEKDRFYFSQSKNNLEYSNSEAFHFCGFKFVSLVILEKHQKRSIISDLLKI